VLENRAPFETVIENLLVKRIELGEKRYIVCQNEEEVKRDQAVRDQAVRKEIASEKKFDGIYQIRRVYLSREDRIMGHI
jgi:hypothetical protein